MQTSTENKTSFLDRPALGVLRLNWEHTLYVVLILLAIFTRFYGLGWRAMSHDESLHVVYSHKLYVGDGYAHDPMMHGPFLFHANTLIYFLFGENDFTGRIMPALFGIILVGLPFFMRKWLGRTGALLTALMFLISPSITYYARYIRNEAYILAYCLGAVILTLKYLDSRKPALLYGLSALIALMFCTKEVAYIFVLIFGMGLAMLTLIEVLSKARWSWNNSALVDLLVLVGTLALPLGSAFVVKTVFGWDPLDYSSANIWRSLAVFLVLQAGAAVIGVFWNWRRWLSSVGVFYTIFILLYTTFFTNGKGFATGIFGSLGYWLAQQGVERGSQPWYYYGIVTPLYEFLPILLSLAAMVVGLIYLIRGKRAGEPAEEGAGRPQAVGMTSIQAFLPFMIYWAILTAVAYSYAGEKMPWLMNHITLPLVVLAGWLANLILGKVNWQELWQRGGAIFAGALILLAMAVQQLLKLRPFAGREIEQLSTTMGWIAALLVGAGLVALAVHYGQRLGWRKAGQSAFAALFILLAIFTGRSMWMANYINYDYATEHLVYAHGTPDIKLVVSDLENLSRRMYGDLSMKFAYDDDSTWPLEWYFRRFPNATYYGMQPSKENMDAPVVIAGSKNWDKVKPFLGNKYYRFQYRLIWWPMEDYKDLTLKKIFAQLGDPVQRKKLWDIIYYRKYEQSTADWPLVHEFAVFVRKDVANQVWDFGARPAEPVTVADDIYLTGQRDVSSVAVLGQPGSGEGQLKEPHNVAVGPGGEVYVLDTGNHRVQVFDAGGQFLRVWGTQGQGDGQLNEPWGIAVDGEGQVFVADTWNHRVVKFSSDGKQLATWGAYGSTDGTLGQESVFWGPRAVAVDLDGNVYVTDTGNKRIQKFDTNGKFLGQWGGLGVESGQFDEPVGLVLDKNGNTYVVDTWNQRIQVFDASFTPIRQWSILTWEGESVINKPYLAIGSDNRLYISDPEGYRVLVYDLMGNFVGTFGSFGVDAKTFNLPTGMAASTDGFVYVADAGNGRVMKFPVLP